MNLSEVFSGIATKMLADFRQIHAQIQHTGIRGREREDVLRIFLERYVPSKYGIATGEIVDDRLAVSKECDLIVFDHLNCPYLYSTQGVRVFPSEPVYCVIEVKSKLGPKTFRQALENIRHVRNLNRDNGVIGAVVFAYESSIGRGTIFETAEYLGNIANEYNPIEIPDLICVLDSGNIWIHGNNDNPYDMPEDPSDRRMLAIEPTETSNLLLFFDQLLKLLNSRETYQPALAGYMKQPGKHDIEIGLATMIDLF
ncbi:MAG: hypothetical protein HYZ26_02080 [Chloroflexi bacterium]|nr:hypothetical protein [Chloroflexota bacterium]